MMRQEIDGVEKHFLLRYNRFDINIESYKKAAEIFPTQEYWKDKIELEEVNERFTEEELKNPFTQSIKDLRTRYWLSNENRKRFSSLLDELEINQIHLANLALVVMYYDVYKLDPVPTRVSLAKELEKALDFANIIKEPSYDLLRISVKGGFPVSLNPREHTKDKPFMFKHPSLMRAMKQTFINWTKTSPDYWNIIGKYAFLIDHVKSPADVLKFKQGEMMIWVYDYIADNGLAKSHQHASFKTGMLLSEYSDIIPSIDHYRKNVEQKGSFTSYSEYLRNHMRITTQRILDDRGRTNRFEKEKSLY
jgi:hypothetical protein